MRAKDFMAAYVKGIRYYRDHGPKNDEIAQIVSKHTGVTPETIKAATPFFIDPDGKPRTQDIATLQDFFVKMGWVKEKVFAPRDRAASRTTRQLAGRFRRCFHCHNVREALDTELRR